MTVEGRPRSRSFSSTPTFSSDLAKLQSSSLTVQNYSDAIALASTFDVLGNNSALTPKLKLSSDDDWIQLFQKSGAVKTSSKGELEQVNMEKFLRYCFDIAYKMPPSPSNRVLRENIVRGASSSSSSSSGVMPSIQI